MRVCLTHERQPRLMRMSTSRASSSTWWAWKRPESDCFSLVSDAILQMGRYPVNPSEVLEKYSVLQTPERATGDLQTG